MPVNTGPLAVRQVVHNFYDYGIVFTDLEQTEQRYKTRIYILKGKPLKQIIKGAHFFSYCTTSTTL